MACVLGCKAFSFKDMAQMSAALSADDFCTPAIRIGDMLDSPGNFIVEAGPAAARLEFVFAAVELRIALPTDIGADRFVVLVFAGAWVLSAFVNNDALLFDGQGIELHIDNF